MKTLPNIHPGEVLKFGWRGRSLCHHAELTKLYMESGQLPLIRLSGCHWHWVLASNSGWACKPIMISKKPGN